MQLEYIAAHNIHLH